MKELSPKDPPIPHPPPLARVFAVKTKNGMICRRGVFDLIS